MPDEGPATGSATLEAPSVPSGGTLEHTHDSRSSRFGLRALAGRGVHVSASELTAGFGAPPPVESELVRWCAA